MIDQIPGTRLSLGDQAGASFRLFRANYRFIFAIFYFPCLYAEVSIDLFQWAKTLEGNPLAIAWSGVAIFLFVISVWLMSLRYFALLRMVVERQSDYKAALAFVKSRRWSCVGLSLVTGFLLILEVLLASAALVYLTQYAHVHVSKQWLPFALIGAFLVSATLLFLVLTVTVFATSTAACLITQRQDVKLANCFTRAMPMVSVTFVRGSCYYILLLVLYFSFSVFFAIPSVVDAAFMKFAPEPAGLLGIQILLAAFAALGDTITTGFTCIGAGLFFNDSRFRLEGLDLDQRLQAFSKLEPEG